MPVAVIRLAVLSLLIFAVSLATHAQSRASKSGVSPLPANGSVAGTIAAPGLTNISGIKITLHSTSGSTKDPSQTTGLDGSFVFYDIVPGTYAVDVDPTTLPQKYCLAIPATIQVRPGTRAVTEVTLEARRSLVGHAFVDLDGNGAYSPGKDTPIADAQIAVGGRFVVTASDGSFRIDQLPAGRTSLIVTWPGHEHTTQVVLDLDNGPVTDRTVNVPLYR